MRELDAGEKSPGLRGDQGQGRRLEDAVAGAVAAQKVEGEDVLAPAEEQDREIPPGPKAAGEGGAGAVRKV